MIRERFRVDIASKTISNWKSNLPGYMEKYGIRDDYIKEVIDRCLFGDIKHQGIPGEEGREVTGNPPREVDEGREVPEEVGSLPSFRSLAEMVGYMERQGFIVATSDQDLRNILRARTGSLYKYCTYSNYLCSILWDMRETRILA
jgi:hypothetical protein